MSATLQRRIIGGIVAVVVVITCIFLGRWQFTRHQDRSAAVEQVMANYEQAPVPLPELIPAPDQAVASDIQWRPVEVEGEFEGPIVKIRNRPVDGKHGFHITQVFQVTADPDLQIMVNRGFVTTEDDASIAVPPTGEKVTLTGHLRLAEAPDSRSAPAGHGFSFNPAQLFPQAPNLVTGAYIAATSQIPPAPAEIVPLPPPDTDLGSHFSYALQWWFFAGGAVVAFFLLLRREDQHAGTRPVKTRTRRRDEAEEDALIAQWEAEHSAPTEQPPTGARNS